MWLSLLCVFGVILLGLMLSPFPHWPTFFFLCSKVVKGDGSWVLRRKQAWFLMKVAVKAPFYGLLWFTDELLFPAYRKGKIQPVFIIGQPRCGTTLLHRTLAADQGTFFAVRHLEWRYPFIVVQKLIALFKLDQRLGATNYWPDTEAGRLAAKMHANRLSDWEEDGIFFEENYLHHFFIFLRFPDSGLLEYVDSFPELPDKARDMMLETHHKVLQKVLYLRGGENLQYLSKEVTSHSKIPFLLERYQGAKFILTVRYANEFMASLVALMRMSTLSKTGMDPENIPGWKDAVIKRMRVDCDRLVSLCKERIPDRDLVHVAANQYMQHIDISTEKIYRSLNLPFEDGFREYLRVVGARQKERDRGYMYGQINLDGFEGYDAFVSEVIEKFRKNERQNVSEPMATAVHE